MNNLEDNQLFGFSLSVTALDKLHLLGHFVGGVQMPNPGQPTISLGATGDAVRRLQRALRRTPMWGFVVDGVFGPATEAAVRRRRTSDMGRVAQWCADAQAARGLVRRGR